MPAGRPTDYRPKYNKQVLSLALLGLTNKEIAEFLEIDEATLYRWKEKFPKFSEALQKGKEKADVEIIDTLRRRAKGFAYDEVTYERIVTEEEMTSGKDLTDKTVQPLYRKRVVKKFLPPDPTSMIYWLKNRRPAAWKDNRQIDHKFDGPISFTYGAPDPSNQPIEDDGAR